MAESECDVDVLIVGAGPVGLLLANLLGARGVHTTIVDRRMEPLANSMAIGITPPSLEILSTLGLDKVFRESGVPVRYAEVYEAQARIGRLDFAAIPSDYQFFLSIPQTRTVEILRSNLRQYSNVTPHDGVEFMALEQDAEQVRVSCRDTRSGAETVLRSRLVIAADGHRSAVRAALGLKVKEKIYPQRFIMADFLDQSDLGSEARLFFSADASVESFPLPGGWRRWIVLADQAANEEPLHYLIRNVRQAVGYGLKQEAARFVSAFGAKRMAAESFHAARVVLAGDAAHVMSSIGGQGMNTGFADAEMLAEILPRVLKQPDRLKRCFAAYDKVRRRAFEVAANRAERGMWLGTLQGRLASWFRKHFIRRVLFNPVIRPRLAPHFAMLTIPYRNLQHVPREMLAFN